MKLIRFTSDNNPDRPDNGTATVNILGVDRDLPACRNSYPAGDAINVYGIAVKYPTGEKVWSASASFDPETGQFWRLQGPLDHRARWAPRLTVLGAYTDFPQERRSKR